MLNLFIRLFMLVIAIFSVEAVSYQSLSQVLNQGQYHQRKVELAGEKEYKTVKTDIASLYRDRFINNGFVIGSFQIKSIKLRNLKRVKNLNRNLFLQQQLIVEQIHFIHRQIQFKFSLYSSEYFS